eukprot:6935558-Prymnesium_polylepis.1
MDVLTSFLDCSDIRNAIRAAFRTWSLNHPRLTFHDVTDECAAPNATFNNDCSLAELFFAPDDTLGDDLAA